MNNLIIVGTGPFAEVAKAYFEEYSSFKVVAFSCHRKYADDEQIYEVPLIALEDLEERYPPSSCQIFVAIGYGKMNQMRQRVYEEVKSKGYVLAHFIHPDVKIWPSTQVGDNVFVFEDNTIQPFTAIGSNTILWSGNHIGHHSRIGDHCFISSHVVISGSCLVGDNAFMGVNATLRDGLKIGNKALIGAGAVIMKDVRDGEVYIPQRTKPHRLSSEEIGF